MIVGVFTSAHPGVGKTEFSVQQDYYWKGLSRDVDRYVASCETCQRVKARQTKPPGTLNPLPIPETRWADISMDFIVKLQMSMGYDAILVIVDRMTKRCHFIATTTAATALDVARIFMNVYFKDHGFPKSIVSDRDSKFMSVFWTEFMKLHNTTLKPTTSFHQSADGQTERTNRFIEDFFRCFCAHSQNDWCLKLPLCEFAFNSRYHDSIKMSPFMCDLGYEPRAPAELLIDSLRAKQVRGTADDFALSQITTLTRAQDALHESQERMKRYYDRNRPSQSFQVGDMVLLNSENLSTLHAGSGRRAKRKFTHRWIGPFMVIEKLRFDNYKIKLPDKLRLHPVFHTSKLKCYNLDSSETRLNDVGPVIMAEGDVGYRVEKIVQKRKRAGKTEYLVKWLGYPSSGNSWEPEYGVAHLSDMVSEFNSRRSR